MLVIVMDVGYPGLLFPVPVYQQGFHGGKYLCILQRYSRSKGAGFLLPFQSPVVGSFDLGIMNQSLSNLLN